MAKTSIKARQRKREKMVAQHAVKRAELKKAGDWKAEFAEKFFESSVKEPLPDYGTSKRIYPLFRSFQNHGKRYGIES